MTYGLRKDVYSSRIGNSVWVNLSKLSGVNGGLSMFRRNDEEGLIIHLFLDQLGDNFTQGLVDKIDRSKEVRRKVETTGNISVTNGLLRDRD
jgi:hypothetical protein